MKEEPVDIKLTSRIRQVFDDFEDPTADTGWQELRKKYPERNRRPLILWLSSAAAVLMMATGLWFVNLSSEQKVATKPAKDEKAFAKSEKISENSKRADDKDVENINDKKIPKQEAPTISKNEKTVYVKNTTDQKVQPVVKPVHSEEAANATVPKAQQGQSFEKTLAVELPEEIKMSKPALVVKNQGDFVLTPINPIEKPTYITEFNPDPIKPEDQDEKTDSKRQKQGFSVFAGSYFNYAEGSESQLNFGAGFTSDIRLSKNLKLSTGLSIAANSLSYDQNVLPESAASSFNSHQPLNSADSKIYSTITSYNAELLSVDIPVNIKYQFIPESDKFYISAGLSSGTYLAETYAYQYRNFNSATGNYTTTQEEDQKNRKQLNDFDLARTLNLSMGLSTRFGKTQTISIEPFLKYPLGGLGSENIKFGSTGINLKIHFKPTKK